MRVTKAAGDFWRVHDITRIFLEYVRYAIPPEYRHFENLDWYVHEKYVPKALLIASAYEKLHLQPGAPRHIVDAVWRALVKVHHPDVGGDPAVFLEYKEAYERAIL